jgi:hypothetical protein
MTKIIGAFIIVLFIVAGWKLVAYYKQVEDENRNRAKVEQGADVKPEQLAGMPYQFDQSLQAAQKNGAAGLREWLKVYGPQVNDPRKAWIEMDYCIAVIREDPIDAKRVFQGVKERTATNSPVFPRVRQLERTFE